MTITLKQFLCELATQHYEEKGYLDDDNIEAKRLGEGADRVVFLMEFEGREIAIKFVFQNTYARTNRFESRQYREMPQPVRDLMAEVFAISTCGRVIAFELLPYTLAGSPDHTGETYRIGADWNNNLKNVLSAHGFSKEEVYNLVADNHLNNLGVRENGDIVWLDYAT